MLLEDKGVKKLPITCKGSVSKQSEQEIQGATSE